MFRIPEFYQEDMTFEQAKRILSFAGDLLKGMEDLQAHWNEYASGQLDHLYTDDYDWFENWSTEANAYNTVYGTMKPLFS